MKNRKIDRNILAYQRTDLAIDRTLLAYIRTSLTIIVVGVSLMKFIGNEISISTGWILIAFSFALLVFGLVKCALLRRKNNLIKSGII